MPKRISWNNRISICISLGISDGICIGLIFELVSTSLYWYAGISIGVGMGSYINMCIGITIGISILKLILVTGISIGASNVMDIGLGMYWY